jgi:hypothetical protein
MSYFPKLNRTLYGRLFSLVPGHFIDKKCEQSREYIQTFNLGNNWAGGLIYRYREKEYYGNASNNYYSKYSKIWIEHNVMALNFTEEMHVSYVKKNTKFFKDELLNEPRDFYRLNRVRFAVRPVKDAIEWAELPRSLINCVNKKSDRDIKSCSCCGYIANKNEILKENI